MQAIKQGGLSGKARRVHYRNRAVRLHTRHLIDEYLHPDAVDKDWYRYIPIRGRKEFLPSIIRTGEVFTADGVRRLGLPAGTEEKVYETARSSPARGFVAGQCSEFTKDKDKVVVLSGTAPRAATLDPHPESRRVDPASLERRVRPETFTFAGFLVGCAMGSAAAALVLLVVQTVLR